MFKTRSSKWAEQIKNCYPSVNHHHDECCVTTVYE